MEKVQAGCFGGIVFGLTGELPRKELNTTLKSNGAKVSAIIHKRVSFVVCTPAALKSNTQKVRRASKHGIPLVSPEFVKACIAAKGVIGYEAYGVTASSAASMTGDLGKAVEDSEESAGSGSQSRDKRHAASGTETGKNRRLSRKRPRKIERPRDTSKRDEPGQVVGNEEAHALTSSNSLTKKRQPPRMSNTGQQDPLGVPTDACPESTELHSGHNGSSPGPGPDGGEAEASGFCAGANASAVTKVKKGTKKSRKKRSTNTKR